MSLPPVTFPTLGWQVIDWMEAMLCHGPGDVQGDDWQIDDEIALFLCWAYRVHPQDHPLAGRRLIQRAVLSRAKGRAKSEIAGGVDCAEALGPVRCDGFDAKGDPVGIPVKYPFIRCMATEEEQSGNTYDNVRFMLEEGRAADEYKLDVGLTRTFIKEPGGGEIRPSTSGDASKDGGKESKATADETHLYILPKLRQMYGTVARNTGKRKIAEPWVLDTTTAWRPGENSVAEQAADRYAHLPPEEAVTKYGVLYDHRQGEEPKRFGDDRSLAKAIRTAYGPAGEWIDVQRIVRIIRDAEDPEETAYRYFLNRPRAAASHWLSPDEITAVLDTERPVGKGELAALGFDGSQFDDHTALWGCTEDGHIFAIGIWAPQPGELEWSVPTQEVDETVRWALEHFTVPRLHGDPPYWQEQMSGWMADYGNPPVIEWWTNRDTPMAVACGAMRTGIRQKTVSINPVPIKTDPQMRQGKPLGVWHFENARTRKVRIRMEDKAEEAYVIRKERPNSPLKIDSVPAAVLALKARDDAMKHGEWKKRKSRALIF